MPRQKNMVIQFLQPDLFGDLMEPFSFPDKYKPGRWAFPEHPAKTVDQEIMVLFIGELTDMHHHRI